MVSFVRFLGAVCLQIEWGTWAEVEKSLFPISLDIALETLHLLASELLTSVGLTRPFLQACSSFMVGACVGVGEFKGGPFKCFLHKISIEPALRHCSSTHFLRLLSSITHLMPSIVQLEHVTAPSAVTWYLCMTSHLTFLARQAAQAFAALRLTGLGFPLASRAAVDGVRFFEPESEEAAGD